MKKKIKIFLTGGNGFFGHNIIELLRIEHNIVSPGSNEIDLLDTDLVYNFLEKEKVDIVIHTAAIGVSGYEKNDSSIISDNLKMFFNLIRAKDLYGKMIFLGSGAEYGKQIDIKNIKEEDFDKIVPNNQYGFYKYICSKYAKEVDFITHLRVFGVYGKYEDYTTRFISNNICRVLFDLPILINQNVFFDYIYINDIIKIIDFFIKNDNLKNKHYNIGSGKKIDLLTIAKKIQKIGGKNSEIIIKKEGLNKEYTCSIDRYKKEVGEVELTDFDKTIKELFEYYRFIKNSITKKDLLFDF